MAKLDLERLLRDLTNATESARLHREARREHPEIASTEDPYYRHRWVTVLSTLQELDGADPARPYLASWILWLLLGRTCQQAEATELTARAAPAVRLATPAPVEVSFREGVRRLLGVTSAGERQRIGDALALAADGPADAAAELWMRRGEILRRAGGAELQPLLQPLPTLAELRAAAERALASTDELARATLRDASWTEALALGLGQQGDVPWPRHLTARWLLAPFEGEARWLDVPALSLGRLPPLLGGASITRALARLGARWADASVERTLPRPLAHLPSSQARLATGALFASLLLSRPFLGRALGLARPEVERARRQQATVMLVAHRLDAARVLAALAALAGNRQAARAEAHERVSQALCARTPASLALALPRLRTTSAARLLAAPLAAATSVALREAHDEDWHRNPRAVLSLRDRLSRAPAPNLTADEVAAAHVHLLHTLTGALA